MCGERISRKSTGPVIEATCENCQKIFYPRAYVVLSGKGRFCSMACANDARRKARRKASACSDCGKELSGADLKGYWGKQIPACGPKCKACRKNYFKGNRRGQQKRGKDEIDRYIEWIANGGGKCKTCGDLVRFRLSWCSAKCHAKYKYYQMMADKEKKSKFYSKRQHRKKTDPWFKISESMRSLLCSDLNRRIRGQKGGRHWESLVGWTIDQLYERMKRLFKPGMNWGNHGEWHVDHIIPLARFNYTSTSDPDFKRAWALSNLQPLWRLDNIRKGAKLSKPLQPSLLIGETL